MGNHRFKFSDMIPNAWFYKLKYMSTSTASATTRATATARTRLPRPQSHRSASASHIENKNQQISSSPSSMSPPPPSMDPSYPSLIYSSYPIPIQTPTLSLGFDYTLSRSSPLNSNPFPAADPPPCCRPSTTIRKFRRNSPRTRRRRTIYRPSPHTRIINSSIWTQQTSDLDYSTSPSAASDPEMEPELPGDSDSSSTEDISSSASSYRRKVRPLTSDIITHMNHDVTTSTARPTQLPPILTRPEPTANTGIKLRSRTGSKKITIQGRGNRRSISVSSSCTMMMSFSFRNKSIAADSFAMVKLSVDLVRDFRDSMQAMITQHNIRDSSDLEDLLACYLSLNSGKYHDHIVRAFEQIWYDIVSLPLMEWS